MKPASFKRQLEKNILVIKHTEKWTAVHKHDESQTNIKLQNPFFLWRIQRELMSLKIAESAPDGGMKSQTK